MARHKKARSYDETPEGSLTRQMGNEETGIVSDAKLKTHPVHAEEETLSGAGPACIALEIGTTIVVDPDTRGGAPILSGTRIAVHDVVAYAREYAWNIERIRELALPDLPDEAIRVALDYYEENKEAIDAILSEQRAEYERLRQVAHT